MRFGNVLYQEAHDGKICMTFDSYDAMVEIAEQLNRHEGQAHLDATSVSFTKSDYFPTIDDLMSHNANEDLVTFLPYLIYYAEVYDTDDENFVETRDYIRRLLKNRLELFETKEELAKRLRSK